MKVIIAGSRTIDDPSILEQAIKESGFEITTVFYGGARGVDEMGYSWALAHGIPVVSYFANWSEYGRAAGPIRNSEMALPADALIAVWDGKSRGTKDMIRKMKGKPTYVKTLDKIGDV